MDKQSASMLRQEEFILIQFQIDVYRTEELLKALPLKKFESFVSFCLLEQIFEMGTLYLYTFPYPTDVFSLYLK